MTETTARTRLTRLLLIPVLALGLGACDNPVEEEEHPEGLVVLDVSGNEVARYTVDAGTATGTLSVGLEAATTFTVHAISEDGETIDIDGDELSIQVGQVRPGWTATVTGVNTVAVTAAAAGTSPLTITLFHIDHPELEAAFQAVAG